MAPSMACSHWPADVLAVVFEHLGVRWLRLAAPTCSAWALAASHTIEGWRILSPSHAIGTSACGSAPGQFQRPTCIARLPGEKLCVADTFNHRIVCMTPAGEPYRIIGLGGFKPGELSYPRGLACDGTHLFVCDTGCALCRKEGGRMVGVVS